jgi:hypothetical protein
VRLSEEEMEMVSTRKIGTPVRMATTDRITLNSAFVPGFTRFILKKSLVSLA